jgi:hypothetical protein
MTDREPLDCPLPLRLTRRELDRLDALASRISVASRNAVARKALQLGVAVLEKHPEQIVAVAVKRPRRRTGR